VAAIKALPETVVDRAILLTLDRKPHEVSVDRFRGEALSDLHTLTAQCARWAKDSRLKQGKLEAVNLPSTLNDRQQDVWEALFAIAAELGALAFEAITEAAIVLSTADPRQSDDIKLELLHDIVELAPAWTDRVMPRTIVEELNALEGRPWAELGKSGLTTNRLGRYLQSFGVRSSVARLDGQSTERAYEKTELQNVALNYLGKICNKPPKANESPVKQDLLHVTEYLRNAGVVKGGARVTEKSSTPSDGGSGKPPAGNVQLGFAEVEI
jgi:hypothetical protein